MIEILAQSFAVCTHYVSQNAQRLLKASELTPALERIVRSLRRSPRIWLAWADEQTMRFVVAELANSSGDPGSNQSLRLTFYDQDGRYLASGEWAVDPHQRWTLCGL